MLESFTDAIPPDLAWVDDLLTRYGRWATSGGRGGRRCGSAEGQYRAPAVGDDDARRAPAPVVLDTVAALTVQRTLVRVPDRERVVLHVLYVPRPESIAAMLRSLQITPRDCRARHGRGLRMFANLHPLVDSRYNGATLTPSQRAV